MICVAPGCQVQDGNTTRDWLVTGLRVCLRSSLNTAAPLLCLHLATPLAAGFPSVYCSQLEISPQLEAQLASIAAGTAVDPRAVNAIVRDLMTSDEDLEEAELPLRARRNPVVAAAAVSGAL